MSTPRTSDRRRGAAAFAGATTLWMLCWAATGSVVAQAPQSPAGGRRFDVAFQMPTRDTCGGLLLRTTSAGAFSALMNGVELTRLLSIVSEAVAAPVVDRTGLTGLVDFTLEYLPERQGARRTAGLDPNADDPLPPPIATALQQQLGLKLEKQMGPLPIVVIDGAERPLPD